MASYRPMSASDLFAVSQGSANAGDQECHWCASACTREFRHDDPPPVPFQRSRSTARRPGNLYICVGCWLWGRRNITVRFLGGGLRDRQCAKDHSWYVTEAGAWVLRGGGERASEDSSPLYGALLKPPRRFLLALRTPGASAAEAVPQLLLTNDTPDSDAVMYDTPLKMTLNNVPHTYTVYELEEAVKADTHEGYGPGVRALFQALGPPPDGLRKALTPPEGREARMEARKGLPGRPPAKEDAKYTNKKPVVASGLRA